MLLHDRRARAGQRGLHVVGPVPHGDDDRIGPGLDEVGDDGCNYGGISPGQQLLGCAHARALTGGGDDGRDAFPFRHGYAASSGIRLGGGDNGFFQHAGFGVNRLVVGAPTLDKKHERQPQQRGNKGVDDLHIEAAVHL